MAEARTDIRPGRSPVGLTLAPAPHVGVPVSSARMAWSVSLCLLPATAWGVFLFGPSALLILGSSVGAALVTEALSALLFRRFSLQDGSAFLTGLLVGLLMPPGVPLYVPAVAAAFGILVVKQTFGGLGKNWMNPALGGVVFALLSWGDTMTRWVAPRGYASPSAVPPLEALRAAVTSSSVHARTPLDLLAASGYAFSGIDNAVVSWLNARVLAPLGMPLPPGSFDVLVGHVIGRIGDVSAPLLLAGAAVLLARRILRWQVPVSYIATFVFLAAVFGGPATGQAWLAGGPGFHFFSGSLVLGAFFMASDPVTSPLTSSGRWIYGIGLGVLTFFLRFFGTLGDGVAVSILLGNCAVPLLDKLAQRRRTPRIEEKTNGAG
jgi:Na+-translocating ferredoxin:NAD+ oxidoreductase subunit D